MPEHESIYDPSEQSSSVVYVQEQEQDSPVAETLQRLPPYVTRGLLYLFILFISIGVTYSAVSSIDIIKSEPATIIPEGHVKLIQPAIDGIVTRLAVREGEEVEEGQILAIVESKEVSTYLSAVRAAEVELSDVQHESEKILPLKDEQLVSQNEVLRAKRDGLVRAQTTLEKKVEDEHRSHPDQSIELCA